MNLYEHKFNNGFDEHFALGSEDLLDLTQDDYNSLIIDFEPRFEYYNGTICACCDLSISYNNMPVNPKTCIIDYYYDDLQVYDLKDIINPKAGKHKFTIVVKAGNLTKIVNKTVNYNEDNN